MTIREQLSESLENLDFHNLVTLWNQCCIDCNYTDGYIHENNEYEIENSFSSPWEALRSSYSYSTDDDYFSFDGYGRLNSFSEMCSYCPIQIGDLADWLESHPEYWDELDVEEMEGNDNE